MASSDNSVIMRSIKRQTAFWNQINTTPIRGLREKWVFPMDDFKLLLDEGELNPFSFDPETHAKIYLDFCRLNGFLQDELFLPALPLTAFPWVEAICGCKVYYSRRSNAIWAEPYMTDLDDLGKLRDYKSNPWFEGLQQYLKILRDKIDGRCPVAITLMRGPGDILSALMGPEKFIFGMEDEPGKVMTLAEVCTEIYIETWKAQMAIIPPFNGGYCCGQLNIWAPEKTIYLQEDSSAILSPRLFREFLLPFHERIAGLAPHFSAMHTHASSIHVLREVLTNKNLKCVQIDIEPEGLKTKDLIRDFQAVQESGKCLMVQGDISDEEVELLEKELSPEGLCIFIVRGFGQT